MWRAAVVQFLLSIAMRLWPAADTYLKDKKRVSAALFFLLLVLTIAAFFIGCSTVAQRLDPKVHYRRDIDLVINGEKFEGVAVPKPSERYEIKIRMKGGAEANMLTITTCHREIVMDEPKTGFFARNTVTYNYQPIKGIEDGTGCLIDIGAYNKEGRHAWATIDLVSRLDTLSAMVKCNGDSTSAGGVSICQAKTGLIQKVSFPERVKVSPDNEHCNVMKSADGQNFEYVIPRGECSFYFGTKDGKFHRHTSMGYESILIREAPQ